MKRKNKILVWAMLGFACLMVIGQLVADLPISKAAAASIGQPANAPIVAADNNEYCQATINKSGSMSSFLIGGSSAYDTAKVPKGDQDNTLRAALLDGKKNSNITFSGANSQWDSDCKSSLILVQSAATPTTFYGLWNTGQGTNDCVSGGKAGAICHPIVHYNFITAYLKLPNPLGSTMEGTEVVFSVPTGGPFTLDLGNASGLTPTDLSLSSAGTGTGAGTATTGLACLASDWTNNKSGYADCVKSLGNATFTDSATIDFAGETYVAKSWSPCASSSSCDNSAEYINYYLKNSPNNLREQENTSTYVPSFSLNTTGTSSSSLDINMDDKGSPSDIASLDNVYNSLASLKTVSLHFNNYTPKGNADPEEPVTTALEPFFDIVAHYYPPATDGSTSGTTDLVQLVWPAASGNEAPYWGNYTRVNATTYSLAGSCSATPASFVFSSDPSLIDKTGGAGVVTAQWKLPSSNCEYDGNGAKVQVVIEPAGTTAPDQTPATAQTSSSPEINCSVQIFNPLSWFLCPLATALETVVSGLDNEINNYLDIKVNPGDSSCSSSSSTNTDQWCSYYKSWSVVRNISLGLITIFALVAIVSQAMGFEIFDAYTIRKVLPRLLVAAIGITLSWPLMLFFIQFTNDLGFGVRQLIYAPFTQYKVQLGGGGQFVSSFFVGGAIVALGFAGLLSFVATAALAAAVAFLVLTLRQMLIVMLVIFAPIAIACYVLPNTSKVWKLWWDSFSKGLLMFPIIAAFIAIGRVFAAVNSTGNGSINQIISFTAYFAPYFLIPFTFRLAGGAISTLGGLVNDRSKGMFDRLKKGRQERTADRISRAKNGKLWDDNNKVGKYASKAASWATDPLNNAAYYGRDIPGLRKRGGKVKSQIEHARVTQTAALMDEINKSGDVNDKAWRALSGTHYGLSQPVREQLQAAGLYGRELKSQQDITRAGQIMQQYGAGTELIGGNALVNHAGRLATLYQDPEFGKASIAGAGIMGLAAHGFASSRDLANAGNLMAGGKFESNEQEVLDEQGNAVLDERGQAVTRDVGSYSTGHKEETGFAMSIVGQAQQLGARSRPEAKNGYGVMLDSSTGRILDGMVPVSEGGGGRALEVLKTFDSHALAAAKSGAVKSLEPTIKSVLGSARLADPNTAEGRAVINTGQAVKDQVFSWAGPYSQASVDVKTEALRIIQESGLTQEFDRYRRAETDPLLRGGGGQPDDAGGP